MWSRLRREEDGYFLSLIEVVWSLFIGVLIFGIPMVFFFSVADSQTASTNRNQRNLTANAAVERMTREIRQATAVQVSNSQVIDLVVPVVPQPLVGPAWRHVRYDCSQGQSCSRDVSTSTCSVNTLTGCPSLSGTPAVLFGQLLNTDVFTAAPSNSAPTYVRVHVRLQITANHGGQTVAINPPIDLTDGVDLRNLTG